MARNDEDVYLMPHELDGDDSDNPIGDDEVEGLLGIEDPEEGTPDDESAGDEPEGDDPEPEVEEEIDPEEFEDAEDPDQEDEEPEDGPVYEITVDGETIQATLEELKKGYSRTQDYTRKQQERAEAERRAQALAVEAQQARQQYLTELSTLQQALAAQDGPEPDWAALRKEDPTGQKFAVAHAEWQQKLADRAAVAQRQQEVLREYQAEQERVTRNHLEAEKAKLQEALPEMADPEKGAEVKRALSQYAKSTYGFTDQDLAQVVDHRVMLILRKAQKFDELNAGREKVKAKTEKVLKPGARKPAGARKKTKERRASERLARSGSVYDAAASIEGLLGDEPELR
jgi:hypothetical protein